MVLGGTDAVRPLHGSLLRRASIGAFVESARRRRELEPE
jgi:hypothetical protein